MGAAQPITYTRVYVLFFRFPSTATPRLLVRVVRVLLAFLSRVVGIFVAGDLVTLVSNTRVVTRGWMEQREH